MDSRNIRNHWQQNIFNMTYRFRRPEVTPDKELPTGRAVSPSRPAREPDISTARSDARPSGERLPMRALRTGPVGTRKPDKD
ncbi:hypothetical protein SprV_0100420400 [Sparganum proliferum]